MKKGFGLKVAILSISFLLMTRLTISPALAEIGKAFPSESQGSLMNMVILASAFAIPFGLLSSFLSNYMKKRTLMFIGLVLYLVGGLAPMFANNYTLILVFRAILGAGIGFFLPMSTGLIGDFFTGNERLFMFGMQSSSVAIGNIITGLFAGLLAAMSWRYSFLIYIVGIASLILVIINIPEPEKKTRQPNDKKSLNSRVLFICGAMLVYAIIYYAFFGLLSFVIDKNHFGDAAAAGIATMFMTAASFVAGLIFRPLTHALKKYSLFVSLLINFVGFLLLSMAGNIGMIFVASIIIGFGFGYLMPTSVMKVTDAGDKSQATFTTGLLMTALNIGTAVSPTILVLIGKIFNNSNEQFIYLVCAIALAVAAVIGLIHGLVTKEVATKAVQG